MTIILQKKNTQNLDQHFRNDKTPNSSSNKFTPVQKILHQRCWWCWRHLEGLVMPIIFWKSQVCNQGRKNLHCNYFHWIGPLGGFHQSSGMFEYFCVCLCFCAMAKLPLPEVEISSYQRSQCAFWPVMTNFQKNST